jgi:hypothetical protein
MSSVGGVAAAPASTDAAARVLAAGVIEAARRRQRRRRFRVLVALLLAIATGVAAAESLRSGEGGGGVTASPRPGWRVPFVGPSSVLSRTPYMGVACPQPNAISCGRLGLAVWLKRPAISVDATIAGQPLSLDWFGEERRFASSRPRTAFDGYLQPAGLTTRLHVRPTEGASMDPVCGCRVGPVWYGGDAPRPVVQLRILYPDHTRVLTRLDVHLSDGWG